jgi:hypothetical protein
VLLIKDFDSHGEINTDLTFMTNADVPVIALQSINDDPINPFTNKSLIDDSKKNGVYITTNHFNQPMQHNKNSFRIKGDQWFFVHDNIFDAGNWERAAP